MEAIEFIRNYKNYLTEIESVVRPEYIKVVEVLKEIDPHDLVGPDTWFNTEINAKGFVWNLFLTENKKFTTN